MIGCSGWTYREWRGPVYPVDLPQRAWLAWYAERLCSVELNGTFYRLPTAETVARWRDAAPPGFVYAVKMGGFATHRKKLIDAAAWLPRHVERFEVLGASLGPTLVQLPPRWHRDTGRLDEFLSIAPRTWRWAVEIRDPSWLHDDVFAVLERHGAALCIHDLIADHPRVLTTDWTYVRFHGPNARERPYHGPYPRKALAAQAGWIDEQLAAGRDVYAYFNNDQQGHAFHDAVLLRTLVTDPVGTIP